MTPSASGALDAGSELELHPRPEARHFSGDVAVGPGELVKAGVVDVLDLDLQVAVQIPVQAEGPAAEHAALDRAVVQVDIGVASRDFPGSPAPDRAVLAPLGIG